MPSHAVLDLPSVLGPDLKAHDVRLACDTAVRSLYPASGIPAVAAAIPAVNSLSINPSDPDLRAEAASRLASARNALLPGTCSDYWLDQVGQDTGDRDTVERIGSMVEERDNQVARLDTLLSAITD